MLSSGVALSPRHDRTMAGLLAKAQVARVDCEDGTGTVSLYSPTRSGRGLERLGLEGDLHRAVRRKELELWYQPIVSLAHGRTVLVETLLRWQHARRGIVTAAEIFDLAPELQLLHELETWIVATAVEQLLQWRRRDAPHLRLTVNLNPARLDEPLVVDELVDVYRRSGLPPRRVYLEMTETETLRPNEGAYPTLDRLREAGYGLAIDDFGTGYSALAYLETFPADILKMDQFFTRAVERGSAGRHVAAAIISLARELRLPVVAEGVETAAQARLLRQLRCDLGQGHYLGSPQPGPGVHPYIEQALRS